MQTFNIYNEEDLNTFIKLSTERRETLIEVNFISREALIEDDFTIGEISSVRLPGFYASSFFPEFCSALESCKNLKRLDLKHNTLFQLCRQPTQPPLETILSVLPKLKKLEYINLENNRLVADDRNLKSFIIILQQMKSLKIINLAGNFEAYHFGKISLKTYNEFFEIIWQLPKLQSLDLRNNRISEEVFSFVCQEFKKHEKRFNIFWPDTMSPEVEQTFREICATNHEKFAQFIRLLMQAAHALQTTSLPAPIQLHTLYYAFSEFNKPKTIENVYGNVKTLLFFKKNPDTKIDAHKNKDGKKTQSIFPKQ